MALIKIPAFLWIKNVASCITLYSSPVNSKFAAGDFNGAEQASKDAGKWEDEIAAVDNIRIYNSCGKFNLNESADLLFHYLILLQAKGFQLNDVVEILKKRNWLFCISKRFDNQESTNNRNSKQSKGQ